jgi:hypothetical protein
MDPQQQVINSNSQPKYHHTNFEKTSYNVIPLQQTTIKRTPTTTNTINNTQNEPETWVPLHQLQTLVFSVE